MGLKRPAGKTREIKYRNQQMPYRGGELKIYPARKIYLPDSRGEKKHGPFRSRMVHAFWFPMVWSLSCFKLWKQSTTFLTVRYRILSPQPNFARKTAGMVITVLFIPAEIFQHENYIFRYVNQTRNLIGNNHSFEEGRNLVVLLRTICCHSHSSATTCYQPSVSCYHRWHRW